MSTHEGGARQLTLVSHYGDKTGPLAQLIAQLTHVIVQHAGSGFEPYALGQVHATLVGLETCRVDGRDVNRSFWTLRQQRLTQDLARVIDIVNTSEHLPFSVRIGGYTALASYPFESRGQHPYVRSFQIQGDRAVFMGWPKRQTDRAAVHDALVQLRRSFEAAHVLHKYHAEPAARDNDLFLVLGTFRRQLDRDVSSRIETVARELLAASPIDLPITPATTSLVAYVDVALPLASSLRFSVEHDSLPAVLESLRATR